LSVRLEGAGKPHILRIFTERKPVRVEQDGRTLAEGTGWQYDADKHRLVVRNSDASARAYAVAW